mgnify:CR=1 FL=1
MGLFLRKSFKAGPVRINLSKNGIGVSGGVKGARVGVNSKGKMYVAGGKGAIRYRKTLGNANTSSHTNSSVTRQTKTQDEIFIDTKVTYPNKINKSDLTIRAIPEPPQKITHRKLFYIIGVITLLFSPASSIWLTISVTSFVIAIIKSRMNKNLERQVEQAQQNQKNLLNAIENEEPFEKHIYNNMSGNINRQLKTFYNFATMHTLFLSIFENPNFIKNENLLKIKEAIEVDDRTYHAAKLKAFKDVFNLYIEDLKLDKDEEQSLLNAIDIINIDKDIIFDELNTIENMKKTREKINEDLSDIVTNINLNNENCFYETPAKIIKEKILRRQTVNGVKIKEIGYVIDREGTAYLTDKRILLVGSGTYSTKIDKILDIIVTPENNTIELTVDGRKTPIIYTVPNTTVFGAKIQKVINNLTA